MTSESQKVALVTGAARRIGRVIALALAARGWDIVVHYRYSEVDAHQTVREIEAMGRRAVALHCDLVDEEAVKELLPRAVAALGSVNCVVNNASIFEHDSVNEFSVRSLESHMRTNLAAPILLARALHSATPPGDQSVVINLLDQKLEKPDAYDDGDDRERDGNPADAARFLVVALQIFPRRPQPERRQKQTQRINVQLRPPSL